MFVQHLNLTQNKIIKEVNNFLKGNYIDKLMFKTGKISDFIKIKEEEVLKEEIFNNSSSNNIKISSKELILTIEETSILKIELGKKNSSGE